MQILWAFRYNPLRMAAQNELPELPKAIPGAGNCLWQFPAYNPAVAILFPQNCVVCHQA
ncbi:MAG: hypothetical protein LBK44_00930 [Spirochaetales bacterium]|jgi:hypothetical protein|nr:hypothetical protein [Spirochaetales bacterium]